MKRFILFITFICCLFAFVMPSYAWEEGGWDHLKVPFIRKTAAPAVTDDDYSVPFLWVDETNDKMYLLIDNTSGAAVWQEIVVVGGSPFFSSLSIDQTTAVDGTKNIENTLVDSSTIGHTVYGQYNDIANTSVVTGTAQNLYGERTWVEKSGADTNANTTSVYGTEVTATNTGATDTGTKNTYAIVAQAVGDTAGISTTYGISTSASGADTNYSIFASQGNVELRLNASENVYINATSTPTTNTDGVFSVIADTATDGVYGQKIDLENTSTTGQGNTALFVNMTSSAVVTATNQNLYGAEIYATKSGADTSAAGISIRGVNVQAQSTGGTDVGTKDTMGGYFSATGDTAGTSTTYGIYAAASGADTNYAGYFSGDVAAIGNMIIAGNLSAKSYTITPNTTTASPTTYANDATVACTYSLMRIAGDGAATTLDTDPAIADGSYDGQILILQGCHDTNTVTIADACNTALSGNVNFTLGLGDMLVLVWDAGQSIWWEQTRSDN